MGLWLLTCDLYNDKGPVLEKYSSEVPLAKSKNTNDKDPACVQKRPGRIQEQEAVSL